MLRPGQLPEALLTVARTFGARGATLRLVHEARRRVGRFRGAPAHPVRGGADPGEHPFRVDGSRLAAATDPERAVERADRVAAGAFEAFRWDWRALPSTPEAWLRNPLTGVRQGGEEPWWKVAHLDPAGGDIKELWEPARFAWAYDLVRGYLLTADDRYARAFHRSFAGWCASSPPFRGPHWSCGQEVAIRAVALLYAEANLASAPSSTPDALGRIRDVLAASGERIADALGYAVSQRNNHAISEAVGLLLLGDRFRGRHPEAERWWARGRRWLERLVREQFAEDGWYIQHSFTYLRLALDQCVVAQRVLRSRGESLSAGAVERLRAAVDLLLAVMDPGTGIVPNHGANDGAFVHPVTLADYRDFRPVVTAACAIFGFPLPSPVEPDPEVPAWLGVDPPVAGRAQEGGVRTGISGWAVARVNGNVVFVRAGRYASRPGHLDPLHVDIRLGGREVVVDPGTFAYNAAPPWRNGLATADVHNGPVLDGEEPGVRGPRFLWYIWPRAELLATGWRDGVATVVAEIPGRLRREVRVAEGGVVVRDEVLDGGAREVRVRWLLAPGVDPGIVRVEGGGKLVDAREGGTPGWFSPRYGQRLPSRCVEVEGPASPGALIVSEFGRGATSGGSE